MDKAIPSFNDPRTHSLDTQLRKHAIDRESWTNIMPMEDWTLEEYQKMYKMILNGMLVNHPEYNGAFIFKSYSDDEDSDEYNESCEDCDRLMSDKKLTEEEFDEHVDREAGYDDIGQWYCPDCRVDEEYKKLTEEGYDATTEQYRKEIEEGCPEGFKTIWSKYNFEYKKEETLEEKGNALIDSMDWNAIGDPIGDMLKQLTDEYYTDEYKYIKQYLECEFSTQHINQIMDWVEEYDGRINIQVDRKTDEIIRGDEDLMCYIQKLLLKDEELDYEVDVETIEFDGKTYYVDSKEDGCRCNIYDPDSQEVVGKLTKSGGMYSNKIMFK